jgi:scyllo-inositol 2-dehydrogenase (NADP+)
VHTSLALPPLSWFVRIGDPALAGAVDRLRSRLVDDGWADGGDGLTSESAPVLVWADSTLDDADVEALLHHPGPVVLAGPTLERADRDGRLAEAAGLLTGATTARHDLRLRPGPAAGAVAVRLLDHAHDGLAHLGEHTHLRDRVLLVDKVADDVDVLLTASVGLTAHPVASWRTSSGVLGWTTGAAPSALDSPVTARLLGLALRQALAVPTLPAVRVGLLGYGAIGHEHSRAVRAVEGLELAAVCDTSPDRLAAALAAAPGVRTYRSGEDLLADPEVDLLVVSTPPSTHAEWALRAIAAGKHVVVEKPFAIRTEEADEVLAAAAAAGLTACVYQNRRFDPDHLALRRAVRDGLLGEVFHLESFVGGYGHPCNLWHSDAEVSGGAFYDWGAHVLDQVLDLLPGAVEHVTAVTHKRRWFDVTNADHSRVTMRLEGGVEAEFVYSDLAAALKPRWYVLGTEGAVVGHWRTERVIGRNDVGTLDEDVLSPADSPPLMELHSADGSVTALATPPPPPYAFHRELADRLLLGLPPTVTGEQSRRVLAVMEAAAESARDGGRPVVPR